MTEAVGAHVRTHFRFFARNRILLAASAIFLVFAGLTILSATVWTTAGGHVALLQHVGQTLFGFLRFLAPGMALLLVFSHVRDRSLRVVLTKPQPGESWLLSGILAVALVAFALHVAVLGLETCLALVWKVPGVLPGLAYGALDSFVRSLVSVGYLTLLATLFHPVVALLVLSLVNEPTLGAIREMLALNVAASPGGVLSWLGERVAAAAYYAVPMLHAFGSRTDQAVGAFRLTGETWLYLAARAGYSLLALAACFAVAAVAFRRKSWN